MGVLPYVTELTSTIPALKAPFHAKKKKKTSKYPETVKLYGVAYYTEIVHKIGVCI